MSPRLSRGAPSACAVRAHVRLWSCHATPHQEGTVQDCQGVGGCAVEGLIEAAARLHKLLLMRRPKRSPQSQVIVICTRPEYGAERACRSHIRRLQEGAWAGRGNSHRFPPLAQASGALPRNARVPDSYPVVAGSQGCRPLHYKACFFGTNAPDESVHSRNQG